MHLLDSLLTKNDEMRDMTQIHVMWQTNSPEKEKERP